MAGLDFVHLHTHSEFSLLDGAARLDRLIKQAVDLNMGALALTDHGVMFGSFDFYQKCKSAGIKPIVGLEAYVTSGSHKDKTPRAEKNAYHLILLCKNETGYKNLLKLATSAAVDGFYYKPRIDHDLLEQFHEGLIATTACIGSEVNVALLKNDYEKALKIAGYYREIFGSENFFIELQDHHLPEQAKANEGLLKISRDLNLKLICTNDIHYLKREDAYAHDVLLCIGTGANINDTNRMRYDSNEFYMKSREEMRALFKKHPEALENTAMIAEMCSLQIDSGRAPMPTPYIPEGHDTLSYLKRLAEEGLERKIGKVTDQYREQLKYELDVIRQTGFAQYFLIVRDFAMFARDKEIFYGVRGSAAGSLTSFCVDITDIDPVDYDLTFERFLNPERVQMPDIDMDFEDARRQEVIEYVTNKYGEGHVAQIVTFGTLAAKAVIKDAGRVLGMSIADVNRITGKIPSQPLHITIQEAMDMVPELKELYDGDPIIKKLIDTAMTLEGISRHSSVHAAGVVISNDPLVEYTPLHRASQDGGLVTQYSASNLEKLGLLKMDFLGLINLTILGRSIENIRKSRNVHLDVHTIPLDDVKAFDLLGRGETTGVFQLESSGMRRYVQELKPNSVRDLAAMVALYRPGPMAHIPTFIRAKHGLEEIKYPHPWLEPVLKETYGVIVYQDQVMRIAQVIAGYSLGAADVLRRVMGKKKKDEMAKQRETFLAGAEKKGVSRKVADNIFSLIEPFAGYAFNKAHAVCYANVAYQTAYLKANYPVEYMAALLACYIQKPDKIATCIDECSRMKINILPPDINLSDADFSAEGDAIRFGLAAIKNVGKAAVDIILSARNEGGKFLSLYDFCSRIAQSGSVTRSTMEALIQSGAFSSMHPNRKALVAILDKAIQLAAKSQRDLESGQFDLFGGSGGDSVVRESFELAVPDISDYSLTEIMHFERDLLGLYLTAHPLDRCKKQFAKQTNTRIDKLKNKEDNASVTIGGLVTSIKPFRSKKNNEPMAFLTLEDTTGTVPVTVFPSVFKEYGAVIEKDKVLVVSGKISIRDRVRDDDDGEKNVEVLADTIKELKDDNTGNAAEKNSLHIRMHANRPDIIHLMRGAFEKYRGNSSVILHVPFRGSEKKILSGYTVEMKEELKLTLEQIVNKHDIWTE
jgi:DNA polymerase-3 subunit alpha